MMQYLNPPAPGFQNIPAHSQQGVTCSAGSQQAQEMTRGGHQHWHLALQAGAVTQPMSLAHLVGATTAPGWHVQPWQSTTAGFFFSLSLLKPKAQLLGAKEKPAPHLFARSKAQSGSTGPISAKAAGRGL